MPIEIRELVVRAVIDETGDNGRGLEKKEREMIVAECVEQVTRILRERNER
jgi:hypothetical protein